MHPYIYIQIHTHTYIHPYINTNTFTKINKLHCIALCNML